MGGSIASRAAANGAAMASLGCLAMMPGDLVTVSGGAHIMVVVNIKGASVCCSWRHGGRVYADWFAACALRRVVNMGAGNEL